jgi:uncharacterized membrane protein YoaK (UPF0700 family)
MEPAVFPVHERLAFGCLLTAAAGGLDAYTYLVHGEVFAGLQTGNVILLGITIGGGHFGAAWKYVIAIIAFLAGTMLIRFMQHWFDRHEAKAAAATISAASGESRRSPKLSRQLAVLLFESTILAVVALVSGSVPDVVATALLSIAAAAQLQEFRKLKGGPFTSLMMTGNLRTLAESAYDGILHRHAPEPDAHRSAARRKLLDTAAIILSFMVGAAIVSLAVGYLGGITILAPMLLLVIAALVIAMRSQTSMQASAR